MTAKSQKENSSFVKSLQAAISTLFIGISYPSIEDAERGLKQVLINRRQYDAIVKEIRNRKRPPWNTPLGGEIGLHGGGTHSD